MKHARQDYNRIQDPENKIPEDEPVFLLRGQDRFATVAVASYLETLKANGLSGPIVDQTEKHLRAMKDWPVKKTPDLAPTPEPDIQLTPEP